MTPNRLGTNQALLPYYVDQGPTNVTAWSTRRIPFGLKKPDWRVEFRDRLKSAISELSPVDGKLLHATYRSPITGYADVENLLIYNVLGDTHNAVTRNGLVFERFCEMSRDSPVQLLSTARHQYEYALVDEPLWPVEGQDNRLLASLSFESTVSALGSCAGVWHAVKTGSVTLVRGNYVAKPWSISVTIDAPSSPTITCSKIVKHLMDGIASALHCHDGSDIDYLSEQLGKSPGLCDEASTRSLLLDSSHALFGATDLLYRYRQSSGVKWNPKDEYCTYCAIRCRYGLMEKGLKISALVFDTGQHEIS